MKVGRCSRSAMCRVCMAQPRQYRRADHDHAAHAHGSQIVVLRSKQLVRKNMQLL
jgi:hypothetical protein